MIDMNTIILTMLTSVHTHTNNQVQAIPVSGYSSVDMYTLIDFTPTIIHILHAVCMQKIL